MPVPSSHEQEAGVPAGRRGPPLNQQPFSTDPAHAALADTVTARLLATARTRRRSSRTRRLVIAGIIAGLLALIVLAAGPGRASAQPCNPRTTPCRTPTPAPGATQARFTITGRINVKATPHGVALTPDGGKLYVTNFNEQAVSVVDPAKMAVITTIPVERGPVNVAVSQDGRRVYVTNEVAGSLSVTDTAADRVVGRVVLGQRPHGMALSPGGDRLYVCNLGSNTLTVVNTDTLIVTGEVTVGDTPDSPAVSPDGRWIWVTNYGDA